MRKIITLTFAILLCSLSFGQTTNELYIQKNYKELSKLEKDSAQLTPDELYMVGFAFFRLENDTKAIEFYNRSIAKGLDDGSVHFYKGLSLCYLKKYDDALKEVDTAIQKEPSNQEFMNQKGLIYKYLGQEDKALEFFEQATRLPNTYGEPFYWVAYIYHRKEEFTKALALYYKASENVPKTNSYYVKTLQSIGQLEYTFTKDYLKSAKAYSQVIQLNPTDYEYYPKLIKAYNAAQEYSKADSIFGLMKTAYNRKELPEEDMEFRNIAIDESEWKRQLLTVYRYLVDPKESLDISYKVYLLSKSDKKIERTFMVEKTSQNPDHIKHLLCEKDKKTATHMTYPYGWTTDYIPLADLKKAVTLVLDGKMKPAASSGLGNK